MTSDFFSGFVVSDTSISMCMLLVKATLILLVAIGITLSMQRASAGARHLVWLVTLSTLLLVPALTAWAPITLRILPAETVAAPTAAPSFIEKAPKTHEFDKAVASEPAARIETPSTPANSLEQEIAGSPVLSGLTISVLLWAAIVL